MSEILLRKCFGTCGRHFISAECKTQNAERKSIRFQQCTEGASNRRKRNKTRSVFLHFCQRQKFHLTAGQISHLSQTNISHAAGVFHYHNLSGNCPINYDLVHSVGCHIVIYHFAVLLFFFLNMIQKSSHILVTEFEGGSIIHMGHMFFPGQ